MPEGLRTWDSCRTQESVNEEEQSPHDVLYRRRNLVEINSPNFQRNPQPLDLRHFVKILMKARLVYRNIKNVMWIVKRYLAIRSGEKWAWRGYYHIEILLSSHGEGKKNPEGLLWGWKAREPLSMYILGQGLNSRKNPPRLGKAEDKGNGLPLRATLRTIPRKMISMKKEQDKGRHGNI